MARGSSAIICPYIASNPNMMDWDFSKLVGLDETLPVTLQRHEFVPIF
jgi:hypothetical protein